VLNKCVLQARVSQLWRMIVELESSVSKGMELQSVQRQLLDAKRQVASLEADFKQSQGSLVQMQQPGQKHGMGLSPSPETFSELSSKSPGQGLRPSANEGGKTGQALHTEGRGVASTPLSCYTDCELQPKEAVPSLEEMASPLICDSNGVHISDSRRQEVPSFDLNSQGPPPPAFGLQHPQQSPPPQYGFHQTRSGAAWSSPDMLALRGAAPAPSYVPIQWSPNLSDQLHNRDGQHSHAHQVYEYEGTDSPSPESLPRPSPLSQERQQRRRGHETARSGSGRPSAGKSRVPAAPKESGHAAAGKSSRRAQKHTPKSSPRGAMAAQALVPRTSAKKRMESSKNSAFR